MKRLATLALLALALAAHAADAPKAPPAKTGRRLAAASVRVFGPMTKPDEFGLPLPAYAVARFTADGKQTGAVYRCATKETADKLAATMAADRGLTLAK